MTSSLWAKLHTELRVCTQFTLKIEPWLDLTTYWQHPGGKISEKETSYHWKSVNDVRDSAKTIQAASGTSGGFLKNCWRKDLCFGGTKTELMKSINCTLRVRTRYEIDIFWTIIYVGLHEKERKNTCLLDIYRALVNLGGYVVVLNSSSFPPSPR